MMIFVYSLEDRFIDIKNGSYSSGDFRQLINYHADWSASCRIIHLQPSVIGNTMFNPDQNRLAPTLAMIMDLQPSVIGNTMFNPDQNRL
ncbi:hypothetical protein UA44_25675, partial [Klebsiella aerogenes]